MREANVTPMFKAPRIRSPKHLAWIRTLRCCVSGCWRAPVHAHHVRYGAGVGMKPDDSQCVPVCFWHHDQGHRIGWVSFGILHQVDLTVIASWLAFLSRCQGRIR